MTQILQLAANPRVAKVLTTDRAVKAILSDLLSYEPDGAEHSASFKSGSWDGRSSLYNWVKGTFPAGFTNLVNHELQKRGYRVQLVRKKFPQPLGPENPVVDEFGNDDPRYDYQAETVRRLLRQGTMIARVATGGGKSKIAKLAVARIRRPTLFLTTRSLLMYQMKAGFEAAGFKVGVMGDSEWTPRTGVNVAMVQTLVQRLEETDFENEVRKILERQKNADDKAIETLVAGMKAAGAKQAVIAKAVVEKRGQLERRHLSDEQIGAEATQRAARQKIVRERTMKILELIELVIGEEAHEVSSDSYTRILDACPNAYYRLALTATPFMKAAAEANMRLMAAFGSIGIEVSEKDLIDRGILARPYFRFLKTPCPDNVKKGSGWQRAYKFGVVENEARNRKIVAEHKRAADWRLPGLCLVARKDHGKRLEAMMKAAGIRVRFIFGETDHEARIKVLQSLGRGELDTVIGSTILDVGVDAPAIGLVTLAGGMKAEVEMRQRIGRGLRAKKSGPNIAFVIDFADEWNDYLRDHARQRQAIVLSTPGFAEGVLAGDFDFSPFAREKAA